MLLLLNYLQTISNRQRSGEISEIPHVWQWKLFLWTLGINLGAYSRNSWILFVILRDGEVRPRSQLLTDVEEIPSFSATPVWSQCNSKRCFLICSPSVAGWVGTRWFDFQCRGNGRCGREIWKGQSERRSSMFFRWNWCMHDTISGLTAPTTSAFFEKRLSPYLFGVHVLSEW